MLVTAREGAFAATLLVPCLHQPYCSMMYKLPGLAWGNATDHEQDTDHASDQHCLLFCRVGDCAHLLL